MQCNVIEQQIKNQHQQKRTEEIMQDFFGDFEQIEKNDGENQEQGIQMNPQEGLLPSEFQNINGISAKGMFQDDDGKPYSTTIQLLPFLHNLQINESEQLEHKASNLHQIKLNEEIKYQIDDMPEKDGISEYIDLQPEQKPSRKKNQTKNISKNFGKAIISFIQKPNKKVKKLFESQNIDYDQFVNSLLGKKADLYTIAHLRELWIEHKHCRLMRILSNHFLRKGCFAYIFNSRISNHPIHIKYRHRLLEVLEHPETFSHVKQYYINK